MRSGLVLAVALFAPAFGCSTSVSVPDGVFACTTDDECPDTFTCGADGRCHTPADASGVDAGSLDGGAVDGSGADAGAGDGAAPADAS